MRNKYCITQREEILLVEKEGDQKRREGVTIVTQFNDILMSFVHDFSSSVFDLN